MRAPSFSKLDSKTLHNYQKAIEKELEKRAKQESRQQKVKDKIQAMAAAEGISLAELAGGGKTRAVAKTRKSSTKTRKKVAPKYRNPDDAKQTWTGRGRKPAWVVAFLEGGGTIDQVAI